MDNWVRLLSQDDIKYIVKDIATKIDSNYSSEELILICILNGASYFTIDLSRELKTKHIIEFIKVQSYHGQTRKKLNIDDINFNPDKLIGKKIIIVDELLDTGHTLLCVKNMLLDMRFSKKCRQKDHIVDFIKSEDIITCVAMQKQFTNSKKRVFEADIVGINLPDVWLVGYGLDDNGYFRNLMEVYAIPKINDSDKTDGDLVVFGK